MWWLLLPTLAYAGSTLWVAAWRRRVAREQPPEPAGEPPRVAIVVAARNEEANIGHCLDALLAQDYPGDRLTIVVADDHSTDRTASIVRQYQQRLAPAAAADPATPIATPTLKLVSVPAPSRQLRGKALAIHTAITACDEELLLMTDADCWPPQTWARAIVGYFGDEDVGVITGATEVELSDASRPTLAAIQALDWSYLLTVSGFLIEHGRPITAMGNNMAFRRTAYEAVGGYPALPFSVTEDYELFRTIVEQTPYRARYPVDARITNRTRPLARLRDVFEQRRRWARGGLRAPAGTYAIYALVHAAHLLPLLVLPFQPFLALGALAAKAAADAVLHLSARSPTTAALRAYPYWQLYFTLYVCVVPLAVVLYRRIRWKGRDL